MITDRSLLSVFCLCRDFEEKLDKESKEAASSKSWKIVAEMCDFGYRSAGSGHLKDTSRMRSVLLQLKNSTVQSTEA